MIEVRIKKNHLYLMEFIYMFLPLVLFLTGWTKWFIAVPCCFVGLFCIIRMYRAFAGRSEDDIRVKLPVFILGILFIVLLGMSVGLGRWGYQSFDYYKHNTILQDIAERSWPVYYHCEGEDSMLTYYIGHYLVPGLVGKILGSFRAAEVAWFVWSITGLVIVWCHLMSSLCLNRSGSQIFGLVSLFFFSVPITLAGHVVELLDIPIGDYFAWGWFAYSESLPLHLQLTPNYLLMTFVIPQVVVCWMTVLMFMDKKDEIKFYIPMLMPSFFFGTISFGGIFILAVVYAVAVFIKDKDLKGWLKQIFSIENILYVLSIGSVLIAYIGGNILSDKQGALGLTWARITDCPVAFPMFYLFIILPYPICLFKWYKKNILFLTSFATLLILPLFHMGVNNDLLMRASIPALFILMVCFIKVLVPKEKIDLRSYAEHTDLVKLILNSSFMLKALLIFFFFDGLVFSIWKVDYFMEYFSFPQTYELHTLDSLEFYANRQYVEEGVNSDIVYNYYTYDPGEHFFCKYIARTDYDS